MTHTVKVNQSNNQSINKVNFLLNRDIRIVLSRVAYYTTKTDIIIY